MKTVGVHLVAELSGCSEALLNDERQLRNLLLAGLKASGLHELKSVSHKFSPIGVTLVSIINESHVSIHTFPEDRHASIDAFHCSNDTQSLLGLVDYLRNGLQAKSAKLVEIQRGTGLEVNGIDSTRAQAA